MTLFKLVDDPNVDYTSPAVKQFFDEIEELGKGLEPPPPLPLPIPLIDRFFVDDPSIERVHTDDFNNWGNPWNDSAETISREEEYELHDDHELLNAPTRSGIKRRVYHDGDTIGIFSLQI